MFDFDDPWWLVAVVLLVLLWVLGAVIPVRLVAPKMEAAQHFVEADESPEHDVPPPVHRPGVLLPTLVFLVGLGLVALSVSKRMNEPEGGNRWMWMSAAAGLAAFWGLILIMLTMRLR